MSSVWTWHAALACLACLLSVAAAYCPPCHNQLSLQQRGKGVPPWKNFVPPAPDAPVTACGCGADHTTPRDEIQEMAPAELRKKIGALESEVDGMKDQLEKMQTDNGDEIDSLKKRLKKEKEAGDEQKKDVEGAADKREKDRQEKKDKIDGMQEDLEGLSNSLEEHRATLKELQSEVNLRLMDMESCGCEGSMFLSLKYMAPDHKDVFKFEELEREKETLSKEIDEEQASFGQKQRLLLHRMDLEKNKMGRREAREAKYKNSDEGAMKSVEQQYKAMKAYVDSKQKALDRVEKDVEKAQERYDKLEKEMAKCGCGPSGL